MPHTGPPLGGGWRWQDKRLDGGKLKDLLKRGFTAERGRSKDGLDEEKSFVCGGRAFG
jgi:hypothetical protein